MTNVGLTIEQEYHEVVIGTFSESLENSQGYHEVLNKHVSYQLLT